MKTEKILYIIVFLLVVVIGLQGAYMYNQSKANKISSVKSSKVLPLPIPKMSNPLKDDDLDKLISNNPFEQMQKMEQNMEKVFNSINSQFASMPEFEKFFKNDMIISPAINMKSYKDRYELNVNIPGSEKNNIKITTKDGMLSIEAKTKKAKEDKSSNFIKKEMFEGTFARSLSLPSDADAQKLTTKYKNGILTIIIPRKS